MKKNLILTLVFCSLVFSLCFAQEKSVLIANFEGIVSGGAGVAVDFGAGNGSTVDVTFDDKVKYEGQQSLKVSFDAVPGGYIWVAKGIDLNVPNSGWMISTYDIKWDTFKAIAFYVHGDDSKAKIVVDLKDDGGEMWRYVFEDNFKGWKRIVCPFKEFVARTDWQPTAADNNATMNFPIKSFQFEPLPPSKGTLYFDQVELIKK